MQKALHLNAKRGPHSIMWDAKASSETRFSHPLLESEPLYFWEQSKNSKKGASTAEFTAKAEHVLFRL